MGAFTSRQHNGAVEEQEQQASNAYKYPPRSGSFFGSHFIMGGERFDTSQPESYLFGENIDLNFLGNRPTAFPYPPPQANEPTKTLKSLVNIRKESVRFVRVPQEKQQLPSPQHIEAPPTEVDGNVISMGGSGDGNNVPPNAAPSLYNIEFTFDSDARCAITIYYFCTEEVSPSGVTLTPRNGFISETYHYEKGLNQYFSQPTHIFNPHLIPEDDLIYNPLKDQFPVAIHCVVEDGNEECRQSHTTICVIDHHPESQSYVLRALKQKIFVDGLCYLLQEIYGIENKAVNKSSLDEDIDDHGSECVICMSETRDTLILPCRHLCLCNSCADSLRYQANNCPICRSPFRALLQIRAVQKGVASQVLHQNPGSASGAGDQQQCDQHLPPGYVPVSLIEALNGPPQYVGRARGGRNDEDVADGISNMGTGSLDGQKISSSSPHKPTSQRRSKLKKNVATSTTQCQNAAEAALTANSAAPVIPLDGKGGPGPNDLPSYDKLQIVNERHSLKLPKIKRSTSASTPVEEDEDSENEKLSPLLSPGNRQSASIPVKATKSKSEDKKAAVVADDEAEEEEEALEQGVDCPDCESENASGSSENMRCATNAMKKTLNSHTGGSGHNDDGKNLVEMLNLAGEDSDYYTPEDTQNSILSPLYSERPTAKSSSGVDKVGSLKSGTGSFKGTNNLKKNLHKKSTSVGNIVGPSAGAVGTSVTVATVGNLKGNVSSLPDMLDSPINSGGNSTSTRSSSDSYSSSSSTKQLLSSNPSTVAANIIVDDKTAIQNAVNV